MVVMVIVVVYNHGLLVMVMTLMVMTLMVVVMALMVMVIVMMVMTLMVVVIVMALMVMVIVMMVMTLMVVVIVMALMVMVMVMMVMTLMVVHGDVHSCDGGIAVMVMMLSDRYDVGNSVHILTNDPLEYEVFLQEFSVQLILTFSKLHIFRTDCLLPENNERAMSTPIDTPTCIPIAMPINIPTCIPIATPIDTPYTPSHHAALISSRFKKLSNFFKLFRFISTSPVSVEETGDHSYIQRTCNRATYLFPMCCGGVTAPPTLSNTEFPVPAWHCHHHHVPRPPPPPPSEWNMLMSSFLQSLQNRCSCDYHHGNRVQLGACGEYPTSNR